jgi:hypothetical protein
MIVELLEGWLVVKMSKVLDIASSLKLIREAFDVFSFWLVC